MQTIKDVTEQKSTYAASLLPSLPCYAVLHGSKRQHNRKPLVDRTRLDACQTSKKRSKRLASQDGLEYRAKEVRAWKEIRSPRAAKK